MEGNFHGKNISDQGDRERHSHTYTQREGEERQPGIQETFLSGTEYKTSSFWNQAKLESNLPFCYPFLSWRGSIVKVFCAAALTKPQECHTWWREQKRKLSEKPIFFTLSPWKKKGIRSRPRGHWGKSLSSWYVVHSNINKSLLIWTG